MDRYNNSEKTYYKATCSNCGEETEVPFQPIEGRKIYCRICFRKLKRNY